ncbi:MAG: winged helix-turn-helix domain-containing protein [Halobacteriaceae archaeon]
MSDTSSTAHKGIPPDKVFKVLGNETRLEILKLLGESNDSLSFSELFEKTDYDDTANFSYHLGKLEGHFVEAQENGYTLLQAGKRVVEAILSGTMTKTPQFERTEVAVPCFLCGGTMEASYHQEHVIAYCTDCGGTRKSPSETAPWADDSTDDIVGHISLPPAGVYDRSPAEVIETAEIWTVINNHAIARDVCARCSALIEKTLNVCENHDITDGHCEECNQVFGVVIEINCTNCIATKKAPFVAMLMSHTDVMAFMIEHGIDPIAPNAFHLATSEETILSTDPFKGRFSFSIEDDVLTLVVDDSRSVIKSIRETRTPSA